VLEVGAVF